MLSVKLPSRGRLHTPFLTLGYLPSWKLATPLDFAGYLYRTKGNPLETNCHRLGIIKIPSRNRYIFVLEPWRTFLDLATLLELTMATFFGQEAVLFEPLAIQS